MRSNRLYLSTTKRGGPSIFSLPRPVLRLGYGGLVILATLGSLFADELPPPVAAPNAALFPNNPAAPDNLRDSTNSPGPNTPLLPQQQISNPNLPLSSSAWNTQSTQITAPALYATGANDVSQIATNTALMQAFSEQAVSGFLSEPAIGYSQAPIERIRLGPFDLKAVLTTTVVYDDNLLAGQTRAAKISDTSLGITPAVLLEYGREEGQRAYASLVYAPTLTRYFHHSDENTDNQNAALNVQYPFQRLTLDLSQTYAEVTGINQDLSSRTTQTSSLSSFGGTYDINDKFSVSSHLQELITSYSGGAGQGDKTSSLNSSLTYHLSAKMTLGPSLNAGLDNPENIGQETFEQALLGFNYQPTEKITFFAQGGAEFRQYDQGGDKTNPIFSAGVGYIPFDSTTLSLNAYQDTHSSALDPGETVVSSGVRASATQRIVQLLYLGFNFNYSHDEDRSGAGGVSTTVGGSQDTLVYRPSLSLAPSAWTTVGLYYQYLDSDSNRPGGSYHDHQMGISASAQF